MNNVLGNNTKAKVLFVVLAILLTLATWYKLKVQGITMTSSAEVQYETILACECKDEEHVHTEDCYKVIAIEKISDEKQGKEENKETIASKTKDNKEKALDEEVKTEKNKSEKATTQPDKAKTDNKDVEEKADKIENVSLDAKTKLQEDETDNEKSESGKEAVSSDKEKTTPQKDKVDKEKATSQKEVLDKEKVEKQEEALNEKELDDKEEAKQDETQKKSEKEETKTDDVKDDEENVEDAEEPPIKQVPPKELKYEDKELIVTVTAIDEGAIPNGAEIIAKQISKDDEKFDEIVDKLIEKAIEDETNLAGFLAYDITLKDSKGKEIEPNGKVNVSLEYKKAKSPIEVEQDDEINISVQHFEEKSNGEITIVDLEETNQLKELEVNQKQKLEKITFETESFSTFTITYNSTIVVTVHYVDEHGTEIGRNQRDRTGSTNIFTLADHIQDITGYQYVDSHFDHYDGPLITAIQGEYGKDPISIDPNEVTYTVEFLYGDEVVDIIEYEGTNRSIDVYLVYTSKTHIDIEDTIELDGCLHIISLVGDTPTIVPASDSIKYKWYKSSTNSNYQEITRLKVFADEYNIPEKDGPSINVAIDEGANTWYKAEKYVNGELLSSDVYHVPYYSTVQNGSFENPVVNTACTFLSDTTQGLVWKTTASDREVEIARTNEGHMDGTVGRTVSNSIRNRNMEVYHFAYTPDGNQAAELNANMDGALYQDILSIPGTQLYWSLYHRARGRETTSGQYSTGENGYNYTGKEYNHTDIMYVIAMSTMAAEKYDVTTQAKVLHVLEIANEANQKVKNGVPFEELTQAEKELYDAEIVKISTTNNGNGIMEFSNGVTLTVPGTQFGRRGSVTVSGRNYSYGPSTWHYYTGNFSIPAKQYLTRYFFVAGETEFDKDHPNSRDPKPYTVGNLIDNITVSDVIPEPNPGQAHIVVRKNIVGLEDVPVDYSVPMELKYETFTQSGTSNGVTTKNPETEELRVAYTENEEMYRYYTHSYPVTIPANGRATLNSFVEQNSSETHKYEVPGYIMSTNIKITKNDGTVIYNENSKQYTGNYEIEEKEIITIEVTNTYEKQVASITVNKVDLNNTSTLLQNAVFKLTGNSNEVTYIDSVTSNQYTADGTADGKITFNDLRYSTNDTTPEYIYVLTELEAPKGYYKFETPIQFYVKYDNENKKDIVVIKNIDEVSKYVTVNDNEITVKDMPYVTMPEAGGVGVYYNYIIGAILVLGATITFNYRKIKLKNEN